MSETGQLTEQTFFPHSSGGWKVKVKVPGNSVPGEGSLPGLETAAFLLYVHMAFPQYMCEDRDRKRKQALGHLFL